MPLKLPTWERIKTRIVWLPCGGWMEGMRLEARRPGRGSFQNPGILAAQVVAQRSWLSAKSSVHV